MEILGLDIKKISHAAFRIKGDKLIYIDPFKVEKPEEADIIFLTHSHYDHLSIEDIEKLYTPNTTLVATEDAISKLNRFESNKLKIVKPGSSLEIDGVKVEVVPSYNLDKDFHKKEENWVGYVLTINGVRVYHAGDTDNIPEMADLENIDIALMPVSGTYVMTAEEAAEAVKKFKPKVAIPHHWGSIVGDRSDAERFKELVKDVKVEII